MAVNKDKVVKSLQLDFKGLRGDKLARAKEEVGSFITSKIVRFLGNSSSPVQNDIRNEEGRVVRGQSAPFKRSKADKTVSRLFEKGDLWSSIEHKPIKGGVKVGVFDSEEIPKGFNHNVGDTLPTRRFIPLKGETFKPSIMNGINSIIDKIKEGTDDN